MTIEMHIMPLSRIQLVISVAKAASSCSRTSQTHSVDNGK